MWDYWFNEFAPQYEGLPGLAPLDVAFNRPTTLEVRGAALWLTGAWIAAPVVATPEDSSGCCKRKASSPLLTLTPNLKKNHPNPTPPKQEAQTLRRRALRTLIPQQPTERRQPRIDGLGRARATGRRKTAVAQVFIWEGAGRVLVNAAPLDQYFTDVNQRAALLKPLMAAGAVSRFDVAVKVAGSGRSGQAQAAAHGIARAMQNFDPAAYRALLKRSGLLKRDPRMVERKKPGLAKARKAFAWVKR